MPSVREIMIPIDAFPYIREDESIGNGVAMILQHSSSDNRHLHFEDLLVIDQNDKLAGMLSAAAILTGFFPSILGASTNRSYLGKKERFTDLSVLLEDNFRRECRRQATEKVRDYMRKPHRSIDASMHLLHVLEIMIKDKENTLPVTEKGVLLGAARLADIFRVLGSYCTL